MQLALPKLLYPAYRDLHDLELFIHNLACQLHQDVCSAVAVTALGTATVWAPSSRIRSAMSRSGHQRQKRGRGGGLRAFTDLFQHCRLASFPKGDFLRCGNVISAVVSFRRANRGALLVQGARTPHTCTSCSSTSKSHHIPNSNLCAPTTIAQDRAIGRITLRLAGSVPVANSVRLPKRHEDSLGAAGRFLYLQLRLAPGKPYAVHADVTSGDRGLHRLSVSNLRAGREEARMKRSGVQVWAHAVACAAPPLLACARLGQPQHLWPPQCLQFFMPAEHDA